MLLTSIIYTIVFTTMFTVFFYFSKQTSVDLLRIKSASPHSVVEQCAQLFISSRHVSVSLFVQDEEPHASSQLTYMEKQHNRNPCNVMQTLTEAGIFRFGAAGCVYIIQTTYTRAAQRHHVMSVCLFLTRTKLAFRPWRVTPRT